MFQLVTETQQEEKPGGAGRVGAIREGKKIGRRHGNNGYWISVLFRKRGEGGNKNTEGLKEGYRRVKETKGRDRLNQTALQRGQSGETGRRGDRYGEEGEKT